MDDDLDFDDVRAWAEKHCGEGVVPGFIENAEPGQWWEGFGYPIEVLLGWTDDGQFLVGRPVISWGGTQHPDLIVKKVVTPSTPEEALAAAKRIRTNRRRTFRRCVLCHELNPPEWFDTREVDGRDEIVCQSCATSRLGVVY